MGGGGGGGGAKGMLAPLLNYWRAWPPWPPSFYAYGTCIFNVMLHHSSLSLQYSLSNLQNTRLHECAFISENRENKLNPNDITVTSVAAYNSEAFTIVEKTIFSSFVCKMIPQTRHCINNAILEQKYKLPIFPHCFIWRLWR